MFAKIKHNFQALHNLSWSHVEYLSFFSPLNHYESISVNSSFMVSPCCVRAASDSDNFTAMQPQLSLSAKNTDGQVIDCSDSTGFRGVATVYTSEALSCPSSLFLEQSSTPVMLRPSNEQRDKCLLKLLKFWTTSC